MLKILLSNIDNKVITQRLWKSINLYTNIKILLFASPQKITNIYQKLTRTINKMTLKPSRKIALQSMPIEVYDRIMIWTLWSILIIVNVQRRNVSSLTLSRQRSIYSQRIQIIFKPLKIFISTTKLMLFE